MGVGRPRSKRASTQSPARARRKHQLTTARSATRERGRPRDEAATATILERTVLLLAEKGYRGFRLEDVAQAARVSKATVYRRWPSKQALVAEAVRVALSHANPESPDSGDARRDVVEYLERVTLMLGGPLGAAIRALVSEVMFDSRLSQVLKLVEVERRRLLLSVVERARASGGLVGDAEIVADVLVGAAYYRFLVRQQTQPSPKLAKEVTALLWREA